MSTTIRDARDGDFDAVLEVNNAAVPNVTALDRPALDALAELADHFRVCESDGQLSGFLIALRPDADYESENFRWFCERYDDFVYIDRVVVARPWRGLGLGRVLYADIQSHAESRAPLLTCEVNLDPPNDVSLLFHGTNGFQEVGRQRTEGGDKHVSLLAKKLPAFDYVRSRYGNA